MPEITLHGPNSASGIWGMYHFYVHKHDRQQLEQFAYYEDEYAKQGGSWRIRRTGYRRVMEQTLSRADIASLALTVG